MRYGGGMGVKKSEKLLYVYYGQPPLWISLKGGKIAEGPYEIP